MSNKYVLCKFITIHLENGSHESPACDSKDLGQARVRVRVKGQTAH